MLAELVAGGHICFFSPHFLFSVALFPHDFVSSLKSDGQTMIQGLNTSLAGYGLIKEIPLKDKILHFLHTFKPYFSQSEKT